MKTFKQLMPAGRLAKLAPLIIDGPYVRITKPKPTIFEAARAHRESLLYPDRKSQDANKQ